MECDEMKSLKLLEIFLLLTRFSVSMVHNQIELALFQRQ